MVTSWESVWAKPQHLSCQRFEQEFFRDSKAGEGRSRQASDEPDPDDGVFISDGGPLFEIVNLQGGPSAWTLYTVNLNQAISTHGLNINNTIQIVRLSRCGLGYFSG